MVVDVLVDLSIVLDIHVERSIVFGVQVDLSIFFKYFRVLSGLWIFGVKLPYHRDITFGALNFRSLQHVELQSRPKFSGTIKKIEVENLKASSHVQR